MGSGMIHPFWERVCQHVATKIKTNDDVFNDELLEYAFICNGAGVMDIEWPVVKASRLCPFIETWDGHKKDKINATHQAYHLVRLGNVSVNSILEFGGGYGCMRRLFFRAGYIGDYTIIDLPEIIELQKRYLGIIPTIWETDPEKPQKADLVLAMWSLSETSPEFRKRFVETVDAKHWWLGFQENFEGTSNAGIEEMFSSEYEVRIEPIEHIPTCHYLYARKKD